MYRVDNIILGDNLLQQAAVFAPFIPNNKILIVTDTNVAPLFLPTLQATLASYRVDTMILSMQESNKNWEAVSRILQQLVDGSYDRFSTLISLGGGVIGDLVGFAASIYMRGMNFIQIPTTLLAQVDAAVGGKTACNFNGIKNLIGTFYMPTAVISDLYTLRSLPNREYQAGLAEVVKYGMACDADFFQWLDLHKAAIKMRDNKALNYLIARCCEIKLATVREDMHDNQRRQVLNFGHTFAHAIEAATDFSWYLHGEAVALGMLLATKLAVKMGLLLPQILDRLYNLLVYLGLPTYIQAGTVTTEVLYSYMAKDKKNCAGTLNLILPCALGQVKIVKQLNAEFLEGLLQSYA